MLLQELEATYEFIPEWVSPMSGCPLSGDASYEWVPSSPHLAEGCVLASAQREVVSMSLTEAHRRYVLSLTTSATRREPWLSDDSGGEDDQDDDVGDVDEDSAFGSLAQELAAAAVEDWVPCRAQPPDLAGSCVGAVCSAGTASSCLELEVAVDGALSSSSILGVVGCEVSLQPDLLECSDEARCSADMVLSSPDHNSDVHGPMSCSSTPVVFEDGQSRGEACLPTPRPGPVLAPSAIGVGARMASQVQAFRTEEPRPDLVPTAFMLEGMRPDQVRHLLGKHIFNRVKQMFLPEPDDWITGVLLSLEESELLASLQDSDRAREHFGRLVRGAQDRLRRGDVPGASVASVTGIAEEELAAGAAEGVVVGSDLGAGVEGEAPGPKRLRVS